MKLKILYYLGMTVGLATAQNAVADACKNKDYSGSNVEALLHPGIRTYWAYFEHLHMLLNATFASEIDHFDMRVSHMGDFSLKTETKGNNLDISFGVIEESPSELDLKGGDFLVYPLDQSEDSEDDASWFFAQICFNGETVNPMVIFTKEPTHEGLASIDAEEENDRRGKYDSDKQSITAMLSKYQLRKGVK